MGQSSSTVGSGWTTTKGEDTGSGSDDGTKHPRPEELPILKKAKGHYWYPKKGHKILDACGGAGVACIGHGNKDVIKAIHKQMKQYTYASYAHFSTRPVQDLSDWLIKSTGGKMQKVYLMCSGSEAVEAALKLAIEYHVWNNQPSRVNFIAREHSYHGTTLGSLSASGHFARREPFKQVLNAARFHHIPACNAYRGRLYAGESDLDLLHRKVAELEDMFKKLGPATVAAVVLEPVVGAALGCVPAVRGYLQEVKAVCRKHGALLILDEVMCGMGRTGVLHAWQGEAGDCVPDLQAVAKGFAGGYQPASALLVGASVVEVMEREGKVFTHGHTYQNHPVVAAAALAVQKYMERRGYVWICRAQGVYLEDLLRKKLAEHPNVGDIRGRGLFWGVEFVMSKRTQVPFKPYLKVAERVHRTALKDFNLLVYHGQGCAGNGAGDHIMIMPPYNITRQGIRKIVERITKAIEKVFLEVAEELAAER
ncbi:hypothetical protein VTI74DRAFT_9982 [Chaetomium olivicolor]